MAAPTPSPNGLPKPGGFIPADWPAQAADTIVDSIDKVRLKTTRPALVAARGVVYGVALATTAVVALILVLLILVRAYENWVPLELWTLYALLGVLFVGFGVLLLRKASEPVPALDD